MEIIGCFRVNLTPCYPPTYELGSVAYIRFMAERGVLEKIAIKTVCRINEKFRYVDTFNAVYFDDDLCAEEIAEELVELYDAAVEAASVVPFCSY